MAALAWQAAAMRCVVLSTLLLFVVYSVVFTRLSLVSQRQPIVATVRECIAANASQSHFDGAAFWRLWPRVVRECAAPLAAALQLHFLHNKDDVKLVSLGANGSAAADNNCTLVSLGVGGDIAAERQLAALRPGCVFYGADPMPAAGRVYEQIGSYLAVAVVVAQARRTEANVWVGPGLFDYAKQNVTAVSLVDFMERLVGLRVVDHLWMDNEGAEYALLPQMLAGGAVQSAGIVFCQLNAELHGPLAFYNMTESAYGAMLTAVLNDPTYLPVYAYDPVNHVRAYFINVVDDECTVKYLLPLF